MSSPVREWADSLEKWLRIASALALGLFVGRLTAELLRPGVAVGILLTLAFIAVSLFVLRGKTIWCTWPLLILLIYVLYPEPDPLIAVYVGLAAAIALIQVVNWPGALPFLSKHSADLLTAVLLSIGFFVLYVNTLAPDVLPSDAGELQLVAARWGVAHPTGFPLYTMLANVATRLPIGPNPAYRANLMSAFTSTATLLFLYLAVYRLTGRRVAGLLAAAALGTSTTFWSQATTANVRSLTAMFTAAAFYLLLVLRDRQSRASDRRPSGSAAKEAGEKKRSREQLLLQALFVWLFVSAVTHHTSLLFIGGLFAIYAVIVQPSFVKEPSRWPVLLLAGLIALLPLLYLPIRGAAGAVGAPDNLATYDGFINHVLGLGFRGDLLFFDQMSVLWARLMVMVNVLTFQFNPFVLVTMLFGLICLFRADLLLGVVLAASVAIHTFVAAIYRAPQTVEYMLPAYVLLAVSFGYAAGYLSSFSSQSGERNVRSRVTNIIAILLVTAMILVVLSQAVQNYGSYRQLGKDSTARDYAQPLLYDAPPNALILADWHWATPLWYLQEVEGIRPDVDVQFVFPEAGLYADTWASQIARELASGRTVIATHFDPAAYSALPLAEPFHDAFLYRQEPLLEMPGEYIPMAAELGHGLIAEGYHLSSSEVAPGQELVVQVVWRSDNQPDPESKLYAHLIGPDGWLYAGDDQPAQANEDGLTVNQFRLTPLLHAPIGTYALAIGSYADSVSDPTEARTVAQIQVRPAGSPPYTRNPVFRPLTGASDERTLIGYDWDDTLPGKQRLYLHWSTTDGYETQSVDVDGGQYAMPEWFGPWGIELAQSSFELERPSAYIPFGQGLIWLGQSRNERQPLSPANRVKLTQGFTAARPVLSDLIVSLRLVGYEENGRSWDWWDLDDGVPALGAIPTLKWITGSRVDHPVYPTVSPDAWPGQESEPLLLLYDAFTSRQLPILDERITQLAPWIPLGRVPIASEP